jgi:hypothetical protein
VAPVHLSSEASETLVQSKPFPIETPVQFKPLQTEDSVQFAIPHFFSLNPTDQNNTSVPLVPQYCLKPTLPGFSVPPVPATHGCSGTSLVLTHSVPIVPDAHGSRTEPDVQQSCVNNVASKDVALEEGLLDLPSPRQAVASAGCHPDHPELQQVVASELTHVGQSAPQRLLADSGQTFAPSLLSQTARSKQPSSQDEYPSSVCSFRRRAESRACSRHVCPHRGAQRAPLRLSGTYPGDCAQRVPSLGNK